MSKDWREKLKSFEASHPEEKGHRERVSSFSVAAAYYLGIRGEVLRTIRFSAVLHGIDDEFPPRCLESDTSSNEIAIVSCACLVDRALSCGASRGDALRSISEAGFEQEIIDAFAKSLEVIQPLYGD